MLLQVSTDIPYGNACLIETDNSSVLPTVTFTPDPHGGPESLWFCFRVFSEAGGLTGTKVRIILKHCGTVLGGYEPANMHPVVKMGAGRWERLAAGTRETQPDGQFSASWVVETTAESFEMAFCYPYGVDEVMKLVDDCDGYWRSDVIGASQQSRPMLRLSNSYGTDVEADQLPGVCFTARSHSGETSGSWALDGFLRELAEQKCDDLVIWGTPLSNIDGVENGDYGKDNFPCDVNRSYDIPPMRHENLIIKQDHGRWRARCQPALALDFHAPGGSEISGVYAFVPKSDTPALVQELETWQDTCKAALGDYAAADFARNANYPSRWDMDNFAKYMMKEFSIPAFSFEFPYSRCGDTILTPTEYREIGKRLATVVRQQLAGC